MGQTSKSVVRAVGSAPTSGIFLRGSEPRSDGGVVVARHVAPDDLAEIVDHVTSLSWDLERGATHAREIVPAPSVDVVFGDQRAGVHGPVAQRTVTRLSRAGSALEITFRPGAFRPLLRAGLEPSHLVDHPFAVVDAFAPAAAAKALAEQLAHETDDATKLTLVHDFLRAHHPGLDDDDRELAALVDVARLDPTLTRVARLAEHAGRPVGAVERLFRSRLGVSAKWVLRRYRISEAATRIAKGLCIDLDALAFLLGYAQREDLLHDFRAHTGRPLAQARQSA